MHVVSAEEMRKLDQYTIEQIGIPARVLMENAGRETAREVIHVSRQMIHGQMVRQPSAGRKLHWAVLVGKGNNGGDGIVAARHLMEAQIDVLLVFADDPGRLSPDAAFQWNIAAKLGIPFVMFKAGTLDWSGFDGVIDALLGTGTRGAPREPYDELIREANSSGCPIVAVDVPSGLNADTGTVYEPCIRAMRTVTFAFTKRGLVQHPGAGYAGTVGVRPIGIPAGLADKLGVQTFLLTPEYLRQRWGEPGCGGHGTSVFGNGQYGGEPLDEGYEAREFVRVRMLGSSAKQRHFAAPGIPGLAARKPDAHKGTYGHVLVVAGSERLSGAGLLCARAALRAGCGLATWAVPQSIVRPLIGHAPEVMLAGIADGGIGGWAETAPDALLELAQSRDALVVGPGIGRFPPREASWLRALWEGAAGPLVLDADALNIAADAGDFAAWPRRRGAATVLTPHPGEMARLAGVPVHEVQRDRIALARRFAVEHEVTLVLKGAGTVVAGPDGVVYVNTTGNPGMATGGAGDVLAGMLGSLLAQGLDAAQAAACGVYWHGAAGDRAAARRHTPGSLIAGDIIAAL